MQFKEAILRPFGHATHHLVPLRGFTKMMVFNVHCIRDVNGNLPPTSILREELGNNVALRGIPFVEGPNWGQATYKDDVKGETSYLSFIFIDETGKRAEQITKARNFMFGGRVGIQPARRTIPYKQCERCFALNHSTDKCRIPPTFKKCGICGKTGHLSNEHAFKCTTGRHHTTIKCNCPPSCFNCLKANKPAAGHLATSDECPLKANMRRFPTESVDRQSRYHRASTAIPTDPSSSC
jgi:hypothetical protein